MSNNIKVVVRCRGRNEREVNAKSQTIVDFHSSDTITISNKLWQLSQQIINSVELKTYKFDRVYGPGSDQRTIYDNLVKPLVDQFMAGFNVTVLAYGQTGTGKTYTMCGDKDVITKDSGIIPRVLGEIFESIPEDFMIRCSFLELYNENLKDLLDVENNGLKIFENKKNSNSIQISNLKELAVNDLQEGLDLVNKGLMERKVALTKLNNFSSRSHTIFTIHLYKQEPGSELFKYSKINLVDLAGLENINKSGSVNVRAKEAGSINQSLLTLGRVINSLSGKNIQNPKSFPKNNHIPYRESKLTRLLQDSIGGKTKTLLISTISPAKINLEETVSTLEYSLKVKDIENKPQLGQDFNIFMKQTLIKDLSSEIIKLNNDLTATRHKHGIYMNDTNYRKLIDEAASNKNEIDELHVKLTNLQNKVDSYERIINDYETNEKRLTSQVNELVKVNDILNRKVTDLNDDITKSIDSIKIILDNIKSHQMTNQHVLQLYQSLKTNLTLLKVNFGNNYQAIHNLINESLSDLPVHLSQLISDLNTNDENLRNFSKDHKDNFEKIQQINGKLNDYLIDYSLDYNSIITKYINERVDNKLQDMKQQLAHNFDEMLSKQFQQVHQVFDEEMRFVGGKIMQENKSTLIAKTNNWNEVASSALNLAKKQLDQYETSVAEYSVNNQAKINDTASIVKNNLNDIVNENLKNLSHGFDLDFNKVNNVLPQIKFSTQQNHGIMTESLNKFNDIVILPPQQNGNKSPLKSPQSPILHQRSLNTVLWNGGVADKENVPEFKRQKLD